MGKIYLPEINIIQQTAKWVKSCGKSTVLKTKPTNIQELKGLQYDTVSISAKSPKNINLAKCYSHKSSGGTIVFGDYPEDYTTIISREYIEAVPEHFSTILGKKRLIKARDAHWDITKQFKPHYYIDKLYSTGKGSGTNSVKAIVKQSLNDTETCGRVLLDACCIDNKTSPAGFYYKLGFRFPDPNLNEQMAKWLTYSGKKENAPFLTGMMYLPKENIIHCLNY